MSSKDVAKAENEQKKEYLRSYLGHARRIEQITEEIAQIREEKMSVAVHLRDMPGGSGQSDLSDYIVKLDEKIQELIDERYHAYKVKYDIEKRIKRLPNRFEGDVLFYHYIAGMRWTDIASHFHFSERQVHRLHARGLGHFQLPRDPKKMSLNVSV